MSKKNVLCFGDSNTWGYAGHSRDGEPVPRFSADVRWPGVLQNQLGPDWHIIEEGLCGRTTAFDDPTCEGRNGLDGLREVLPHMPALDVAVVALGINDLKPFVCGDPRKSAEGLGRILDILQTEAPGNPEILVILPPPLGPGIFSPPFSPEFGRPNVIEESEQLNREQASVAKSHNTAALDGAQHAKTGSDGLHYDAESHIRLGKAAADAVQSLSDNRLTAG